MRAVESTRTLRTYLPEEMVQEASDSHATSTHRRELRATTGDILGCGRGTDRKAIAGEDVEVEIQAMT